MIDIIMTLSAYLLRYILRILSIGRHHKKRVVFFSYFGAQYSCNPKYISQYMQTYMPEFEIVWAFTQPENFKHLEANNIKLVKYNSPSFLRTCLTSRYIITNSEIPSWFPLTKHQTLINTWHGGGAYKKVGASYQKETKGKQLRAYIARKNRCIYVSSSQAFSKQTLRQSFQHTGEILAFGMPRNDMLVMQNRTDLFKKVKDFYGIPSENHILLYAPTYRESKSASEYLFDCTQISLALKTRFGGNWSILFRMHYFIMEQLNTSAEYIDASHYSDMQELLYASDVLITDYSSSMWDFALMYKPCFLFATDLDQYDLTRGFYTDIHTWPYPLAENTNELVENIQNFNLDLYVGNVKKHFYDLGNQESGHSAEKICNYLKQNL